MPRSRSTSPRKPRSAATTPTAPAPAASPLTEIVVVLDRSGSMASIKQDMEGGFNTFIAEQRKLATPCTVTLVQFDSWQTETVYEGKSLADVPALTLEPRGGTPLLAALGDTIERTVARHAALAADRRPGTVIVLTITDGEENTPRNHTKASVKRLIEQQTAAGWIFSFLGANVDAFADAAALGISPAAVANFSADSAGVRHAYAGVSNAVLLARAAAPGMAQASYTLTNTDPRHAPADATRRAAATLGSAGGKVGGSARAAAMTPEERKDSARKAAAARWSGGGKAK